MKTLIIAASLALGLLVYESANLFILEQDSEAWDCFLYPGTDTCVGCIDDCLEPEEVQS